MDFFICDSQYQLIYDFKHLLSKFDMMFAKKKRTNLWLIKESFHLQIKRLRSQLGWMQIQKCNAAENLKQTEAASILHCHYSGMISCC